MSHVLIREVGLRDGLQSVARTMATADKCAWIDALFAAGLREIEVASFVPAKLLPRMADAAAVVRHALTLPGQTVIARVPTGWPSSWSPPVSTNRVSRTPPAWPTRRRCGACSHAFAPPSANARAPPMAEAGVAKFLQAEHARRRRVLRNAKVNLE
jgi:hypothetical protein